MVIDLYGLEVDVVRAKFPELYQYLLSTVRVQRQKQADKSSTKDAGEYLEKWWLFGKTRSEIRPALEGMDKYIAIEETGTHRIFQFLDASILPDNMITVVASGDAFHLGILASRVHVCWALRSGGWQGEGNDPRYTKSRCFDPFPFPDPTTEIKDQIRLLAEEIDTHRKRQYTKHTSLTLTAMYNVLARLNEGVTAEALGPEDRVVYEDGLVLILKELHDRLDAAVAAAYGWPMSLSEQDVLARLVALNQERAAEEARGHVR